MKASRYNFTFQALDGTHLVFNALTGALARLPSDQVPLIQTILAEGSPFDPAAPGSLSATESGEGMSLSLDDDLRQKLLRGGFLVPDDVDECDVLKVRYHAARFDPQQLKLTVLPTLDCNFRCSYCYEQRQELTMSAATQEAVVEFARRKVERADTLGVNWYGGEPLLALDIIEHLSTAFRRLCQEHRCTSLPGGIVTNGYLLTRPVATRLRGMGITKVQVTLDGPRDVHNRRRPLAGNAGTFDRIVDNLAECADLCDYLSVRVNSDRDNAERVVELLDTIESRGLKNKVSVYFAKVMAHTPACAAVATCCIGDEDFSELELRWARQGLTRGFDLTRYPLPKFNFCDGDLINAFVIAPDGYLYKCWSDPGNPAQAVGHVSDAERHWALKKNFYKWMAWDVFDRTECRECAVLPVCMGGCPYLGLRRDLTRELAGGHGAGSEMPPQPEPRGVCERVRFNLIEMLRIFYASRAGSREKAGTPA
jgi:uncharacterized protein